MSNVPIIICQLIVAYDIQGCEVVARVIDIIHSSRLLFCQAEKYHHGLLHSVLSTRIISLMYTVSKVLSYRGLLQTSRNHLPTEVKLLDSL